MKQPARDHIWSIIPQPPIGVCRAVAARLRARRLHLGWSRETLASRSGVNQYALKRFELSGHIPLESLVKAAVVLGVAKDFDTLFAARPDEPATMAELEKLNPPARVRGRTQR